MGLESSRYSRIQIAMTTGSDPGSYDWGVGSGCVVSWRVKPYARSGSAIPANFGNVNHLEHIRDIFNL